MNWVRIEARTCSSFTSHALMEPLKNVFYLALLDDCFKKFSVFKSLHPFRVIVQSLLN